MREARIVVHLRDYDPEEGDVDNRADLDIDTEWYRGGGNIHILEEVQQVYETTGGDVIIEPTDTDKAPKNPEIPPNTIKIENAKISSIEFRA